MMPDSNPNDLLTTEEVAEIARTTSNTVRYWRVKGHGPAGARVGRRVLYRRSDVDAWVSRTFDDEAARRAAS